MFFHGASTGSMVLSTGSMYIHYPGCCHHSIHYGCFIFVVTDKMGLLFLKKKKKKILQVVKAILGLGISDMTVDGACIYRPR